MKAAFIFLLSSLIILSSCSEKGEDGKPVKKKYLPPSSGTHAEMLIVADDNVWESKAGEVIFEVFGQEQYGLPQSEGVFSLNRVRANGFQGLLERAKSIVFIELGDTTLVESKKDVLFFYPILLR